jgi:hypothetical protein
MSYDVEKNAWIFQKDFDTRKIVPEPLCRIYLGDGSTIRLYFGPLGVMAYINKSTKDSKCVFIGEVFTEIEIADLGKQPLK